MEIGQRVEHLVDAFASDGYDVEPYAGVKVYQDCVGIAAVHRTATIGGTQMRKKAFYLEGPPYAMGYLMGMLAEPDVGRMCDQFADTVLFGLIGLDLAPAVAAVLGEVLGEVISLMSLSIPQDLPLAVKEEMRGLLDGCRAANPGTGVSQRSLGVLNYGFDGLLAFVFTGIHPAGRPLPAAVKPANLRVPFLCNAFSVAGDLVEGGGHFLGRDFMFPTADVFQETACHIIRHPSEGLPTVSVAAPGMVGSITALNSNGVAGGVDVAPSGACDPSRPGINSLLLVRESIEQASTCEDAVGVMEAARRGTSWAYILADGTTDRACVVEAVRSGKDLDVLSYPPARLLPLLPDRASLDAHPTTPFRNGLMVRWSDTDIPEAYPQYNPGLFAARGKVYDPAAFKPDGYVDRTWQDRGCPGACYFPPQRESCDRLVLLSNGFMVPEMRLTAMMPWTDEIVKDTWDDFQWRYDELCHRLLTAIEEGPISRGRAREIIDFLDPAGDFPSYYNAANRPLDEVQVKGATSLLDLKGCAIESHFGYYADEWVKVTLPRYVVG